MKTTVLSTKQCLYYSKFSEFECAEAVLFIQTRMYQQKVVCPSVFSLLYEF